MSIIDIVNETLALAKTRGIRVGSLTVDPITYDLLAREVYGAIPAKLKKIAPVLQEVSFNGIPVQTDREKFDGNTVVIIIEEDDL